MTVFTKLFGDPNERELKKFLPIVNEINQFEPEFEKLKDEEFAEKTEEFKSLLAKGKTEDEILPASFALVREAAKRTLNQRHFDVQLVGGIVLHQGKIAEMKTGEGKTLASTLPLYLNALRENGVHLVTVNDYLARRDTVWMGQVYHLLGLSVGCITHESSYVYDPNYISEAGANETKNEKFPPEADQPQAEKIDGERDKERDKVGGFKVVESYLRPVERRQAYLADITYGTNNEFGFDYLRDNLIHDKRQMVQRGHWYAIVDEVDSILIDEARTPLIISAPAEESADLYYQLARLVKNLGPGRDYTVDEKMHASFLTEAGQNKIITWLGKDPWATSDFGLVHYIEAALDGETLFKKDKEYVVKNGQVIIVDEFTGRLMPGRRWSDGRHQAVEAKEHISGHPEVEAKQESRTLATITFQNYFRFYKKLAGMTGTAVTEAEEFFKIYNLETLAIPTNRPMIRENLADRIYRTEDAKFKAIIEEVKARHEKGQPILIGTPSVEKNEVLGDLLLRNGIKVQILNAKNHEREGEIIAQAGKVWAVTLATNMAGRGVDIVLGGNPPQPEKQKKVIEFGGLHVIGTERHEARRIDNQLRGRSGRQGDPGSAQFFVSLEDDLMRIFGGERLAHVMKTLNVPEDVPIENQLVSRAIASAQQKVEGFNFDARKHLLEYDDVLNKHRETIYRKRREILVLGKDEIRNEILKMIDGELEKIVGFHTAGDNEARWNIKGIVDVVKNIFPVPENLSEALSDIHTQAGDRHQDVYARDRLIKYLFELAKKAYKELEEKVASSASELGLKESDLLTKIERSIMLRSIDTYWVGHLEAIANLKGGIGLRAYGQLDPLVEYKRESFKKFSQFLDIVRRQVVYSIYKVGLIEKIPPQKPEGVRLEGPAKITNNKQQTTNNKRQIMNNKEKPGRNDPCPCGKIDPKTGKPMKYKKCCYPKYG